MLTVTAFNFGATQIDQTITLPKINPGPVVNMINEANAGELIPASCGSVFTPEPDVCS